MINSSINSTDGVWVKHICNLFPNSHPLLTNCTIDSGMDMYLQNISLSSHISLKSITSQEGIWRTASCSDVFGHVTSWCHRSCDIVMSSFCLLEKNMHIIKNGKKKESFVYLKNILKKQVRKLSNQSTNRSTNQSINNVDRSIKRSMDCLI